MSKYRFKTEEEFKRDGLWKKDLPFRWVKDMLKYLGTDIPDKLTRHCDKQEKFRHESWHIEPHDYVLKETAFVLPSKWCIKVDRDCQPEEVYKWRQFKWFDAGYINEDKDWTSFVLRGHTEITLEQFKQHVLKESSVVESPKGMDMKAVQEEAKKRFPIGCKFIPAGDVTTYTLIEDYCTYEIHGKYIWAHNGHGHLYENGKWATLVSSPETKKEMFYEGLVEGEIYIYDGTQISTYPEGPSLSINGRIYTSNPKWTWCLPITHATEEQKVLLRCEIEKRDKKTITEEWSEGTYAVGVKGNFGVYKESDNLVPVGKVFTIKENRKDTLVVKDYGFWIYKKNLKWFATQKEALDFSKGFKEFNSPLWPADPIVEQRINTPSIKKETFIDNVQSVDVILRTKRKSFKF